MDCEPRSYELLVPGTRLVPTALRSGCGIFARNDPSPTKRVAEMFPLTLIDAGRRALSTVPLDTFEALMLVRPAPLAAMLVTLIEAGRRALSTVPLVTFEALMLVRPAPLAMTCDAKTLPENVAVCPTTVFAVTVVAVIELRFAVGAVMELALKLPGMLALLPDETSANGCDVM